MAGGCWPTAPRERGGEAPAGEEPGAVQEIEVAWGVLHFTA